VTAPDCPFPNTCPVPDPESLDLRKLRIHTVAVGTALHNVTQARYRHRLFNRSGVGSARFSPLTESDGSIVGHVYAGSTTVSALLETTFHEVGPGRTNQVDVATDLRGWHQRLLVSRRPLRFADFRDARLECLGLLRENLVSTTSAHYPCTRQWAQRILGWGAAVDGIVWDSRLAEVAAGRSALLGAIRHAAFAEASVIYAARVTQVDVSLTLDHEDLASDSRRPLVDEIANLLEVAIL